MNIQHGIGNRFGYIEKAYYMGVNAYFVPRQKLKHMQHLTMDLENIVLKLIITDRHIFLHDNWLTSEENWKNPGQEVMYSSECFNSNHMEFVGYETLEK